MTETDGDTLVRMTLTRYMQELRAKAGVPSLRKLAVASNMSHSCVDSILNGRHPTSWHRVEALVEVLDGDRELARELWATSRNEPLRFTRDQAAMLFDLLYDVQRLVRELATNKNGTP